MLGSFWGVELGGKGLAAGSSRGEPSKCMFQNSACAGVLPSKADFENMHLLGNFWVELGSKGLAAGGWAAAGLPFIKLGGSWGQVAM